MVLLALQLSIKWSLQLICHQVMAKLLILNIRVIGCGSTASAPSTATGSQPQGVENFTRLIVDPQPPAPIAIDADDGHSLFVRCSLGGGGSCRRQRKSAAPDGLRRAGRGWLTGDAN